MKRAIAIILVMFLLLFGILIAVNEQQLNYCDQVIREADRFIANHGGCGR